VEANGGKIPKSRFSEAHLFTVRSLIMSGTFQESSTYPAIEEIQNKGVQLNTGENRKGVIYWSGSPRLHRIRFLDTYLEVKCSVKMQSS